MPQDISNIYSALFYLKKYMYILETFISSNNLVHKGRNKMHRFTINLVTIDMKTIRNYSTFCVLLKYTHTESGEGGYIFVLALNFGHVELATAAVMLHVVDLLVHFTLGHCVIINEIA